MRWLGLVFVLGALGLACLVGVVVYLVVPYEPGAATQTWSATVTGEGHAGTYTGFGLGSCGDESSARGASVAKRAAMEMACARAGLCPDGSDTVCDCSARAEVRYECEQAQTPGRTHLGDWIDVPVH